MTRQNATNFTGTLQFPYANAPTDLFKKEDVQVLAQAVDQHDHSTGKGLVLSAGSIPAGSITSAMIADGTIDTVDLKDGSVTSAKILDLTINSNDIADGAISRFAQLATGVVTDPKIAAHAVTQVVRQVGLTSDAVSTSTTYVDIPEMTASITTTGGDLLVFYSTRVRNTVAGALVFIALNLDGSDVQMGASANAAGYDTLQAAEYYFPAPSAGGHTIKGRGCVSTGTGTWVATDRRIIVVELKH